MSASTSIRRGRISTRIGKTETTSQLPAQGTESEKLTLLVEEKRKLLEKLVARISRHEEQHRTLRARVEKATLVRDQHSSTAKAAGAHATTATAASLTTEKAVARLKKDLQKLESSVAEITDDRKTLKKKLTKSEKTLQQATDTKSAIDSDTAKMQSQLHEQEKYRQELEQNYTNDQRIATDLINYLKRLTKNVFDQQRQMEQLQTGAIEGRVAVEGARRRLREENRVQKQMQAKINDNINRLDQRNRVKERNELNEKALNDEYSSLKDELKAVKSDIKKEEAAWLDLQQTLAGSSEAKARLQSRHGRSDNRAKRYKTKLDILRLKPTATMYQSYSAALSSQAAKTEKALVKKKHDLRKAKAALDVDQANKKKRHDYEEMKKEFESLDLFDLYHSPLADESDSSGDEFSTPVDEAFNELREYTQQRQQFLQTRQQDAESTLNTELQHANEKVEVLQRETDAIQQAIDRVKENIESRHAEAADYTHKISIVNDKIDEQQRAKEEEQRAKEQMQYEQESSSLTTYNDLLARKASLERARNERAGEIKQTRLDIASLRNTLDMYRGWKKQADAKSSAALLSSLHSSRASLVALEGELQHLSTLVDQARHSNAQMRERLTVIKPYHWEHGDYQSLREQEKSLDWRIKKATGQK